MSYDVDSGTRDLRLDLPLLFYLRKFNLLVVDRKCRKEVFCMDYEVKFTEVKQAR